jgi:hypothetical protein
LDMKFRRHSCIYCGKLPSTPTGDHVFARKFFLEHRRGNLPKVPCCRACGDEKSRFEQYLTTGLPFGGRHADAGMNLNTQVPDRLAKNRKLHVELARCSSIVWTPQSSGLLVRTMALPIAAEKLEALLVFIVKGLLWHHWGVTLGSDDFVEVHMAGPEIGRLFDNLARRRAKARVKVDLGAGTFAYEGAQGTDNDAVSVWEFTIYGGLTLGGGCPGETVSRVGAMTGPRRVQRNAERRLKAAGAVLRGGVA